MSVLKQILLIVSLFIFVGGAYSQNFKKIKKAGIEYQNGVPKSEEIMADDNEFNRVRICFGCSNDGHYNQWYQAQCNMVVSTSLSYYK